VIVADAKQNIIEARTGGLILEIQISVQQITRIASFQIQRRITTLKIRGNAAGAIHARQGAAGKHHHCRKIIFLIDL